MTEEKVRTDITKEEAARRQLDTAIALHFCGGDAISVHVLASSVSEIVTDTCKAKGITCFRDVFMEHVVPEYEDAVRRILKKPYNFFKHANRDHDKELDRFNPDVNPHLLFSCCWDFALAYSSNTSVQNVFTVWFLALHPNIMKDAFPVKNEILVTTQGLAEKPAVEQLQTGRVWLREYISSRREPLPFQTW